MINEETGMAECEYCDWEGPVDDMVNALGDLSCPDCGSMLYQLDDTAIDSDWYDSSQLPEV